MLIHTHYGSVSVVATVLNRLAQMQSLCISLKTAFSKRTLEKGKPLGFSGNLGKVSEISIESFKSIFYFWLLFCKNNVNLKKYFASLKNVRFVYAINIHRYIYLFDVMKFERKKNGFSNAKF